MTPLDELKAIIVKAVPGLESDIQNGAFGLPSILKRELNFEDVLMALRDCKKNVQFARLIYEDFIFLYTNDKDTVKFYLNKSLSEQPESTILRLLSLLKHD
jgi:hypothetical protein